jgi:hypothetical protein
VRRFSLSRRAKGVLAGVAFLFSVGAVSTKLLSGRVNDFCFCVPPVAQPAFTMPETTTADAEIHGGVLPGRVVAAGAPVSVSVINVPPAAFAAAASSGRMPDRDLAHLGVLWGTSHNRAHGSSSSRGHFAGAASGGGGLLMGGGHNANTKKTAAKTSAPKAAQHAAAPSRPSTPAPAAGVIIPPAPVLPPAFGSNADPVPGFGNGATGPTAGGTPGSLGGTLGGTSGGLHTSALSVTPEPTMLLFMITGVAALLFVRRRDNEAH